jgi:hypothetical protein
MNSFFWLLILPLNDGKRWWIVTVFWEAESPDNPLPKKYLETKN